eukprot:389611_1
MYTMGKVLDAFCKKPWSSNEDRSQAFQLRLQRGPIEILEMIKHELVFFSVLLKESIKVLEIGINADKIMRPDFAYTDMILSNNKLQFFNLNLNIYRCNVWKYFINV